MSNNYEIDITDFFNNECARDFSASVAEIGKDAGPSTWQAAKEAAVDYDFLDNQEKVDNFKKYIAGFGAWTTEEVDAWSHRELNALLIQFIAGDMRSDGLDKQPVDWVAYQEQSEAGQCSGRIYGGPLSTDGRVYFSISD
jgi:hypothetical protein